MLCKELKLNVGTLFKAKFICINALLVHEMKTQMLRTKIHKHTLENDFGPNSFQNVLHGS